MKILIGLFIGFTLVLNAFCQLSSTKYPYYFKPEGNPFARHIRTADPHCHVWHEGRLWMYTSQDHHYIVKFNNIWYYFYHTGNFTNNKGEPGRYDRRNVCVYYLFRNKNGTIKPIIPTNLSVF